MKNTIGRHIVPSDAKAFQADPNEATSNNALIGL